MIDEVDLLKIVISIGSLIALYLFRRSIVNVVGGMLVGDDISSYNGSTVDQVVAGINEKLDEILGER